MEQPKEIKNQNDLIKSIVFSDQSQIVKIFKENNLNYDMLSLLKFKIGLSY